MSNTSPHRLPETATPERYVIRLTPDLTHFTFTGEETITIIVHEATHTLVLNACELTIQQVALADETDASQAGSATLDEPNERVVLEFPQAISPGRYALQIAFEGVLNDQLHGFYRSMYKDADGNEKTLATTQFEATDARRAFPCWDEPAAKAVFQATLVIDEGLTAISNTAVVSEDPVPGTGKKAVVFADTIKMSTYLVAFIVGEFEASEPVYVGSTPLRVWAVPGKQNLSPFGRAIGAASLQFFSDYYGRPYPGDKLDLIAIPDFAFGAMENLGAITFRETALLIDEQTAARSELERVADVVSHENAHMWFGDLVTMRWWNGIWLNEAFATWAEMMAVDAWKPEWQRWTSFAVSRAAALQVDGLHSSRPIEFPVEHPDEAQGMFDILTYEKGAAILRMLEQYLGPQAFQKGVNHYLGKHEYDNAETTDLWDALEEATQQPVRSMMDSWVFQAGYPLISVAMDGSELVISQQPFHYMQNGNQQAEDKRWQAPIFIKAKRAAEAETQTALLTTDELRLPLSGAAGLGRRQRGRVRLLSGPIRPRPARPAHRRYTCPALSDRALQPDQRYLGDRAGRSDAAVRLSRPPARIPGRVRPQCVGRHSRLVSLSLPSARPGTASGFAASYPRTDRPAHPAVGLGSPRWGRCPYQPAQGRLAWRAGHPWERCGHPSAGTYALYAVSG